MKAVFGFVILFINPFPVFCELPHFDQILPINDHHPTYQGYGAGYDHPDNQQHGYHRQGVHGSSGFYSDHGHKRHNPEHLGVHYGHDLLDKTSAGHETVKENAAWNRNRGEIFIKKASWDQDEGRRHHLADTGHHDGHYSDHGYGNKHLTHGGVDEGYSRKGGHLLLKAYNEGAYNKEKSYKNHHIPIVKHLPSIPLVPIHEPQYNLIKHKPLIHEKIAYLKPILDYRPEVAYIDDDPYHNYDKHLPRPDPIVYNKPYTNQYLPGHYKKPYTNQYLPGHYKKHENYHNEHLPVYRDHLVKPYPKHFTSDYREAPLGYDHQPPRHHSYHVEPYNGYHQKPLHAVKKHILPLYEEKPLLHKPDIYIPGVPDVIPEIRDVYPLGSENQGQKTTA